MATGSTKLNSGIGRVHKNAQIGERKKNMIKFSCVVRKFDAKDGRHFVGANAKGSYLMGIVDEHNAPLVFEADKDYDIRFTISSLVALPKEEGIYNVEIDNEKGPYEAWIDARPEHADWRVLRILTRGPSVVWTKTHDLTVKEK